MKFSLLVALVLWVVWVVAASMLYALVSAMGVFDKVDQTIQQFTGTGNVTSVINARAVIEVAGVIGLVNGVLFAALATLGAFIYNLCADLVGGIEVTLAEGD
jgi:hypothetical protein